MKHYLKYTKKRTYGLSTQIYCGQSPGLLTNSQVKEDRGILPLQHVSGELTSVTKVTKINKSPSRLVLLIGCEYVTYEKKGAMKRLPGCHMDIRMAQKMLMEHYGYNTEDFIIVSDETLQTLQPTRDVILKQLDDLVERCKRHSSITQVVLYYSGHGTQTKDINGDEEDGMDECIVPCDFMEHGLIEDDIFFDRVWSKLPLSVKVTCVFDCCNSGTIFDLPFLYDGKKLCKNPKITSKKLSTPLPLIVTLSGCRDPQTSASAYNLEKNIDWEGAMSYALREILKRHNYTPTPITTLIDEMRTLLSQLKFSQVPQLGISRELMPNQITHLF